MHHHQPTSPSPIRTRDKISIVSLALAATGVNRVKIEVLRIPYPNSLRAPNNSANRPPGTWVTM